MTLSDPFVAHVHEVSLRYGRQIALDRVSLAIPAGKRIALIGPDGVGKSSLLGLIAGSRRIQTGKVKVLGGAICEIAAIGRAPASRSPTCRKASERTFIRT